MALLFVSLSACTTYPIKSNTVTTLFANDSLIKVTGRTSAIENNAVQFGYPGVSFEMNITRGNLSISAFSTSNNSYLALYVDDLPERVIKLSDQPRDISLVTDDGQKHSIKLSHRSETWHGIVTINNVSLTHGEFLAPPAPLPRKMLVIGDSVTCGEAIERATTCEKETSWWNPELSYGLRLAKALKANGQLVCYGGRGVIRSWNGKTDELQAPDFYELSIAQYNMPRWDHKQFEPELILISLGTNDFSLGIGALPLQADFVGAYASFVKRLLKLHPRAKIALTEGAIVNDNDDPARPQKTVLRQYLTDTAQRVNDSRVHVVPSVNYPGDDCDAHPNKEQHKAMADDLTPILRKIMAW